MDKDEAKRYLKEAKELNDGPWIGHSKHVARLAERIAAAAGMEEEKAYCMGLLHDIGRRNGKMQARHAIEGYRFLMKEGFPEIARICLTHTFQYQNVDGIYGSWDCSPKEKEFVRNYLAQTVYDDYDKLIQLCDALSLSDGWCFAEKKMVASALKFGVNEMTLNKWKATLDLKKYFDEKTGSDIYEYLKKGRDGLFQNLIL